MRSALLQLGKHSMGNSWTVLILMTMLAAAADLAVAQYGGPSMLSRGGNSPGRRGRAPMNFVVYGAVRGSLETGLTPVSLDEQGNFTSNEVYGVQTEIGAYGARSWSQTSVGLDYRGDYRQSSNKRFQNYNGTNQALSLDVQHRVTKRTMLVFRETGGTTNRGFGGFAAPAAADVNSLNLANTEVFDTRTYFSNTTGTVVHQRSARMSLLGSADAFFVKRPDPRLVGVNGYRLTTGADYRVSRRLSLAGVYSFVEFSYPRAVGGARMHGVALTLNRTFMRNISASIGGGAFRLTTFGNEQIQLSPEVAAILGRSTGVAAFTRTAYVPQANASVRYTMERSNFFTSVTSGVTPGNGVYQTSKATMATAGYTYTGMRRLSLGLSANHTRLSSQSVTVGNLKQTNAGVGITYQLRSIFSFSSQLDWRKFDSPGLSGRSGYSALVGLSVSGTRLPLSIW